LEIFRLFWFKNLKI